MKIKKDNKSVVLIAEDHEESYILLDTHAKRFGYKTIWAKNGVEAIEKLAQNDDINLVLMDIKMPHMDGIETLQMMKKLKPDLPIIAQTAFAMTHEKFEIMQHGFDGFMEKPITTDRFDDVLINTFVKKHILN